MEAAQAEGGGGQVLPIIFPPHPAPFTRSAPCDFVCVCVRLRLKSSHLYFKGMMSGWNKIIFVNLLDKTHYKPDTT